MDPVERGRQALEAFWAEHSDGARSAAEYLSKHPSTRQAWGRRPERKRGGARTPKKKRAPGRAGQRTAKAWANKRRKVYGRDGFRCVVCGLHDPTGDQLTLDHIRPESHGGSNARANLQTMCAPCNTAKGNAWDGVSGHPAP